MASAAPRERELVFCHSCENEWYRDEHGLVCPECASDVVEIIDPNHDPRAELLPNDAETADDDPRTYEHPFGDHYPWNGPGGDAPDPDEGDIDQVRFSGPAGMRFSSTTYVSGPGGFRTHTTNSGNMRPADVFPQMLQSLLTGGPPRPAGPPPPLHTHPSQTQNQGQSFSPQGFEGLRPDSAPAPGATPTSPLQEGPFRMGGSSRGGIRIMTTSQVGGHTTTTTQNLGGDDLMGILGSILTGIGGASPMQNQAARGGVPHPLNFLAQMFDPANARSGDAVYTNEALDRIVSQLMEQNSGSTAPGPASEGAIASLPRIKLGKEQLGEGATGESAECAICMDSVPLGDEVTELPCHHWFHTDCVAAWLREHDTCPQCRRGIMPKDGDQNAPRATGQAPRFWQMPPSNDANAAGPANDPAPDVAPRPRTNTASSSGIGGSLAGWMGRLRPRGSRSSDGGSNGGAEGS